MKSQNTNYTNFISNAFDFITRSFIGPWKTRSLGLIALLIGFYIGSNLTVFFFEKTDNRLLIVLIMTAIIEFIIRIRGQLKKKFNKYILIIIDNLRIGTVYAVVLEAFKLGS